MTTGTNREGEATAHLLTRGDGVGERRAAEERTARPTPGGTGSRAGWAKAEERTERKRAEEGGRKEKNEWLTRVERERGRALPGNE